MHTYPDVRKLPGPHPVGGPPGRHAAHSSRGAPARPLGVRTGRHGVRGQNSERALRVIAAGVLCGTALSLMIYQYQFRHLEAVVAAHLYRVFTPVLAASRAPVLWFGLGTTAAYGLDITPECSSALLIVPLCGLGMLLLVPRRLAVNRVIRGLIVAAAVMVAGNLLRIGVIAVAVRYGGLGAGYQLGHLILGSIVSIVCIGIGLTLLTVILVRRRPARSQSQRRGQSQRRSQSQRRGQRRGRNQRREVAR
ncbi:MAG TPA: exosortase/archaeosortase family protein [Streptosporangiaceae bacterium]